MIDQILRMVDQELEDFENDKNRRTGLKSLVEFTSTNIEYNGDESNFEIKPKFKQHDGHHHPISKLWAFSR